MQTVSRVLIGTEAIGNPWLLSLELCRALEEEGVEVVLMTMGRKLSEEQRRAVRKFASVTLEEHPFRVEWMNEPWDDVAQAGEILLSVERRDTPDVVHLHGIALAALPFRAPVVISADTELLAWWEATKPGPFPESFERYRERARRGLRAAAAVVSTTHAGLADLSRLLGPCSNPKVIPVGADSRLFTPDTKENFIFSASRAWDGARNLELLRRASEQLRWPLYVARDDTRPPGPPAKLERADEGGRLNLLGSLSRAGLAERLGRAAVYALPGSVDPSGLSVLEAALSGCALVLGETAALREVWADAALFVAQGDHDDLVATLNRLADNLELTHCLGARARERSTSFDGDTYGRSYLTLYDALVRARP